MTAAGVWRTGISMLLCAACTIPVAAQSGRSPFRARSLEVSAGGAFLNGAGLGDATATLTRNQSTPAPYPLFETDTELSSGAGFEGRIGFHLTRAFAVEGAFVYARPTLETRISGDAESGAAIASRSAVDQYLVEGSAVYHVHRWRVAGGVPFVLGGAGYLRQLHENRLLVEEGHAYHTGGGFKFVFGERSRGWIRAFGVRIDGRVYFIRGGVDLSEGEEVRTSGAAAASVVVFF